MRRFMSIGMVVLVLSFTLATAVSADFIEGTGAIKARGAGIARIVGEGRVDVRGHGLGTVWVRNAEELSASGHGIRMDLPGNVVFFGGWSGQIHAAGEELAVTMAGGLIQFVASGTGTVFLQGRGHYWLNGEPGNWSLTGITIDIAASQYLGCCTQQNSEEREAAATYPVSAVLDHCQRPTDYLVQ